MLKLSDHWRSATTRLILIYGAFFVLWGVVLVGVVYWETGRYLSHVVDAIVEQRAHYLGGVDRAVLPEAMEATGALDLRGVMSLGLFGADGTYIDGNIERVPADLPIDGAIHPLPQGLDRRGRDAARARARPRAAACFGRGAGHRARHERHRPGRRDHPQGVALGPFADRHSGLASAACC